MASSRGIRRTETTAHAPKHHSQELRRVALNTRYQRPAHRAFPLDRRTAILQRHVRGIDRLALGLTLETIDRHGHISPYVSHKPKRPCVRSYPTQHMAAMQTIL